MTCTICAKTSYPAETVLFDQRPFHAECFKCTTCSKKMEAFGAAQYEGTIYCKFCFDKGGFARKQAAVKWTPKATSGGAGVGPKLGGGGMTCTSCGKTAYTGECAQYDGKPYHIQCLRCSECSKECTMSNLAQFEGKLYCLRCFEKGGYARKQASVKFEKKAAAGGATQTRFAGLGGGGSKCYTCNQTVYPAETILFEQRPYHAKCFRCLNCSKEMTVNQAEHKGDKVYCQKCFMSLGLHMATLDPVGAGGKKEAAPAPKPASPTPAPVAAAAPAPVAASPEPEPEPEPVAAAEPEPAAAPAAGGLSAEEEIAALKQKLQEQEIALLKQKLKDAEAKLGTS